MANLPGTRKRVHAMQRAPDGSAFIKCDNCGVSVAVALMDMHACGTKVEVKRFKGACEKPKVSKPNVSKPNVLKQSSSADQLRSPFRFFMEDFVKTCKSEKMIDIDRKGFEAWKNMSKEEKQPYISLAKKVDAAHKRDLIAEVGDDADSAMVGKGDKLYEDSEDDEFDVFCHSGFESWDTHDWEMAGSWIFEKPQSS